MKGYGLSRREAAFVVIALLLPIPLFAASGLGVPLPGVVDDGLTSLLPGGGGVAAPAGRDSVRDASARVTGSVRGGPGSSARGSTSTKRGGKSRLVIRLGGVRPGNGRSGATVSVTGGSASTEGNEKADNGAGNSGSPGAGGSSSGGSSGTASSTSSTSRGSGASVSAVGEGSSVGISTSEKGVTVDADAKDGSSDSDLHLGGAASDSGEASGSADGTGGGISIPDVGVGTPTGLSLP